MLKRLISHWALSTAHRGCEDCDGSNVVVHRDLATANRAEIEGFDL